MDRTCIYNEDWQNRGKNRTPTDTETITHSDTPKTDRKDLEGKNKTKNQWCKSVSIPWAVSLLVVLQY